ncbi:hypothetical protein PBY51_005582 [Eleginops maclovinus]|uniref:Uncharacterized protein n=1 Tax=Eleginops maclovinus TaxID=56733 RepID=A0AAN7X8M5_ELEMC|nr:hypothetical protein PBY51_005582 [Eleginops maclovinus]
MVSQHRLSRGDPSRRGFTPGACVCRASASVRLFVFPQLCRVFGLRSQLNSELINNIMLSLSLWLLVEELGCREIAL